MSFAEALKRYLDARDSLARLQHKSGVLVDAARAEAVSAMTEAAARMDELMPCGAVEGK